VYVQFFGAVVHRHVSSQPVVFTVGEELVHEGSKCESALQVDARLAVLTEYYVEGVEGRGGTDGYSFFAGGDHVEGQAALSLGFEHEEVHYAYCRPLVTCLGVEAMLLTLDHVLVHLQCFIVCRLCPNLFLYYLSVLVHHSVRGYRFGLGRLHELHCIRELAIQGSWK
jgi:hypothetical protein